MSHVITVVKLPDRLLILDNYETIDCVVHRSMGAKRLFCKFVFYYIILHMATTVC